VTRFVVDASVAVEYLLRTPLGLSVADIMESASLVAPELMDAEVLSVLRRAVLRGKLDEARAEIAIDDLCHWPVDRMSNRALAPLAWRYHRAVSAYDAFYVAAAHAHESPLLTADGRLARASGLDVILQHVHMGRSSGSTTNGQP
jgi:predicted nucleic acid-binding protein